MLSHALASSTSVHVSCKHGCVHAPHRRAGPDIAPTLHAHNMQMPQSVDEAAGRGKLWPQLSKTATHSDTPCTHKPSATATECRQASALASAISTCLSLSLAGTGWAVEPAIRPELTPNQQLYDPKDPDLIDAALMMQDGLNAKDIKTEEDVWTTIIKTYSNYDREWIPDIVGRAYGNRGNCRTRQGRIEEALADYDEAIRLSPWSPNPVLNRGIAYEALGRYEDAADQYRAVIAVDSEDPAGWNNLGNAMAGLGRWDEAVEYYGRASRLAPGFSFAAANEALGLYQMGDTNRAVKEMRTLLRRYPDFTDMRAGLTAALWAEGLEGQAESQWDRVDDPRYKDKDWLKNVRKWPPRLSEALIAFLDLRSL